MIVSIHQPQYMPWLPYFSKIASCDTFVFLDDVQFQKNGIQNRNQLKNSQKILFYSSTIIGLFIGFGYIFQGIILSFLVYYITFNKSDLFSILVDDVDDEDNEDEITIK